MSYLRNNDASDMVFAPNDDWYRSFSHDYNEDVDEFLDDEETGGDAPEGEGFKSKTQKKDIWFEGKQFISGHLSSPIYEDEVLLIPMLKDIKGLCTRHNNWRAIFLSDEKQPVPIWEYCSDPYKFITDLLDKIQSYHLERDLFDNIIEVSRKTVTVQYISHVRPAIRGGLITQEQVSSKISNLLSGIDSRKSILKSAFSSMKHVEAIKDSICLKEIDFGETITCGILTADSDLALLHVGTDRVSLPTSLLLGALDKVQARFPLLFYWALTDSMGGHSPYSIFDIGIGLIGNFEKLRQRLSQNFFPYMGAWEAIVKGSILLHEGGSGSPELYYTSREEMEGILSKYNVTFDISDIIPPASDEVMPVLSSLWLEISGIVKIFGYPTLVGKELLDPLREFGTGTRGEPKFDTMMEVMAIIKRNWAKNFFNKERRLPNFKEVSDKMKPILSGRVPEQILGMDLDEWKSVRFAKTLPYDSTPDQLELLKDSACSVPLSSWASCYDACAFKALHNKPRPRFRKVPERRVLMHFVTDDQDTLERTLKDRERGIIDEEDLIASNNGKEKEIKPGAGRAFTKQTPAQRLYQTSMEHNVANGIFRYVPEQTMTMGDLQSTMKIQDMVTDRPGFEKITFCFDMKKWCLHQRQFNTAPISRMYDDIFDTGVLFSVSHEWFLRCNIFNGNRLCPPDYDISTGRPVPGANFMSNFEGGNEGMQQKKWTHVAIGAISLAIERSKYHGESIGQGDNQIATLDIPLEEEPNVREIAQEFLASLRQIFLEIGHILKSQETWTSSKLHEYGKMHTYAGVNVRSGTKKASNILPDINDGLSSHASCIASINTSTEGIARGDTSALPAFMINQFLVLNYCHRKGIVDIRDKLRCAAVLMVPADFGGLPLSTYQSHNMRGISDKVTLWISIHKECQNVEPELFELILRASDYGPKVPASKASERSRLFEDTYCLNVKSLPSIGEKIVDGGVKYLQSDVVKNPILIKLKETDFAKGREDHISVLGSMDPMPITFISEAYQKSNAGIIYNISRQFTKAKTIERRTGGEKSYLAMTKEEDILVVKEMKDKISKERKYHHLSGIIRDKNCPFTIAEELRRLSWGVKLLNATQAAHWHQATIRSADSVEDCNMDRSIIITTSYLSQVSSRQLLTKRGPFKPYIGGSTAEKVKKAPSSDIVVRSSLQKACSTLFKLLSYIKNRDCNNLKEYIMMLIEEKRRTMGPSFSDDELRELEVDVVSGSMFHRLIGSSESSYAILNKLVSVSTHFQQSTDLMAAMSIGGQDWNVFFQRLMSENVAVLTSVAEVVGKLNPGYLCSLECDECTHLVSDDAFDLPDLPSSIIGVAPIVVAPVPRVRPEISETLVTRIMAEQIAKNIDHHHRKYHLGNSFGAQNKMIPINDVSKNDLRRINLDRLLPAVFLSSKFCAGYISQMSKASGLPGHFFSLQGLADLVITAGLQDSVVSIMGCIISDHKMVTSSQGMADAMGRSLFRYMGSQTRVAIDVLFKYKTKDEDIGPASQWDKNMNNAALASRAYSELRSINWGEIRNRSMRTNVRLNDVLNSWKQNNPIRYQIVPDMIVSQPIQDIYFNSGLVFTCISRIYPHTVLDGRFSLKGVPYAGRPIGSISTAASKYAEIILTFGLPLTGHDVIACIAEGSGSVVTTLALLNPDAKIIYNTLIREGVDTRSSPNTLGPPGFVEKRIPPSRLVGNHEMMMGTTDILDSKFVKKFMRLASEHKKIDVFTMDAESPSKEGTNIKFLRVWGPLFPELSVSVGIFKMFYSPGLEQMIKDVMGEQTWMLWKPVTSNASSNEVFLIFGRSVTKGMVERSSLFSSQVSKSLGCDKSSLDTSRMTEYVDSLRIVSKMLLNVLPPVVRIRSKWDQYDPPKDSCGSICVKILWQLVNTLQEVDSYQEGQSQPVSVAIRSSDINSVIKWIIEKMCAIVIMNGTESIDERSKYTEVLQNLGSFEVVHKGIIEARKNNPAAIIGIALRPFMEDSHMIMKDYRFLWQDLCNNGKCRCPMRGFRTERIPGIFSARVIREIIDKLSIFRFVREGAFKNVISGGEPGALRRRGRR